MTRCPRWGLVGAFTFLVLTCVSTVAQQADSGPSPGALSPARFRSPGRVAGVHAWWHWLDGAITREGITKDLEALRAQGVVQATILNVGLFDGRDFGVPRRPFMWGEPARFTTRFAVETSRDGRSYSPLAELRAQGLNRTDLRASLADRARGRGGAVLLR